MTTWHMRASARNRCFDYIGHAHLDLIAAREFITEVEVTEVPADDHSGSYWGWIDADGTEPVMIRAGHALYSMQFTYGPEAEERRGKGRTVRLRVTETTEGQPS